MNKIPHQLVLGLLVGSVLAAMIINGIYTSWSEAGEALFGNIGLLPFGVAVATIVFLAIRSRVDSEALENTRAALDHTRRAEVATRFQRAVEMLANENEATRIGGLYILRDVIIDSPATYWRSAREILVPFMVARSENIALTVFSVEEAASQAREEPWPDDLSVQRTPADVVVAFRLAAQADREVRRAVQGLDVPGLTLSGVVLSACSFTDLVLNDADFEGAIVFYCRFDKCSFARADVRVIGAATKFFDCDFTGASLTVQSSAFAGAPVEVEECDLANAYVWVQQSVVVSGAACNVTHATIGGYGDATFLACWFDGVGANNTGRGGIKIEAFPVETALKTDITERGMSIRTFNYPDVDGL